MQRIINPVTRKIPTSPITRIASISKKFAVENVIAKILLKLITVYLRYIIPGKIEGTRLRIKPPAITEAI